MVYKYVKNRKRKVTQKYDILIYAYIQPYHVTYIGYSYCILLVLAYQLPKITKSKHKITSTTLFKVIGAGTVFLFRKQNPRDGIVHIRRQSEST